MCKSSQKRQKRETTILLTATMDREHLDNIVSLISQGCKLVKELESTLPNLFSNQQNLSDMCEEIVAIFTAVRERLNAPSRQHQAPAVYPFHMPTLFPQQQQQQQVVDSSSLQELLRNTSAYTSAMSLIQTQLMGGGRSSGGLAANSSSSAPVGLPEFGGRDIIVHPIDSTAMASSSNSSLPRHRRRKDNGDKRIIKVPAPQTGNTEIPPDDGYTWRKYGQKEILGSKYPRGYYRCTHQKLYNCPAKKQVQRLDNNPSIYEVTYREEHTCHMSATAPSVAPPPPAEMGTQEQTLSPNSLGEWLEFRLSASSGGGGGVSNSTIAAGGSSSSGAAAGPSTVRPYGRSEAAADQYPIMDMADVMFNSGSSSSNSMEFIFSSHTDVDKWDHHSGEKKN